MKIEAIKLRFLTPVHLGRGRDELDRSELIYHSDSMKAAIYAVGFDHFPEWKDASLFFNGFTISSCFPYAGNEFFLPKPFTGANFVFDEEEGPASKKAKQIAFLSYKIFTESLRGNEANIPVASSFITPDGLFLCADSETCRRNTRDGSKGKFNFFKEEVQQRVSVPSEGEARESRPFYVDRVHFEDGCGLYFMADFRETKLRGQVMAALRMLGENGIGTDRTVGNGQFCFDETKDVSSLELQNDGNFQKQIALGLYLPCRDELEGIDLDESSWTLMKRGGYMAGSNSEENRHLRRKSIYMFGEGSLLSSQKPLKGKFVDLKPEWDLPLHPVWRCGMPLFIKFK